jgi:dephospho-CoA kinase
MKTYGLTGGIASGKSTALRVFQDLGVEILDTDQLARDVIAPGTEGALALEDAIGASYFVDGALDRKALRAALYTDSDLKQTVEAIVHPRVAAAVTEWRQTDSDAPYRLLCSPLLLETSSQTAVDAVIILDVPTDLQVVRATTRDDQSVEQVEAIIAAQINRADRLAHADFILDNTGTEADLATRIHNLHRTLLNDN